MAAHNKPANRGTDLRFIMNDEMASPRGGPPTHYQHLMRASGPTEGAGVYTGHAAGAAGAAGAHDDHLATAYNKVMSPTGMSPRSDRMITPRGHSPRGPTGMDMSHMTSPRGTLRSPRDYVMETSSPRNTGLTPRQMDIMQGYSTQNSPRTEVEEMEELTAKTELTGMSGVEDTMGLIDQVTLEDFVGQRLIGTGTYGTVYLVLKQNTEFYFAIKCLRKVELIEENHVAHAVSELSVLRSMSNPFVVNLWATFKTHGYLYFVLDYVEGGELFTYLHTSGHFSDDVARFYAAEILLALESLHRAGFIYRDLKPENVLLDRYGHIKLTDFGFSKFVPDNRTYTICGTREYMAPEMVLGLGHGREVDFWALGILIHEMLTGYPPFRDDNPEQLYMQIVNGPLDLHPDFFSADAINIMTAFLVRDPRQRLGAAVTGMQEIKGHPWFANIDWRHVYNRMYATPIVPILHYAGDTCNYTGLDGGRCQPRPKDYSEPLPGTRGHPDLAQSLTYDEYHDEFQNF